MPTHAEFTDGLLWTKSDGGRWGGVGGSLGDGATSDFPGGGTPDGGATE